MSKEERQVYHRLMNRAPDTNHLLLVADSRLSLTVTATRPTLSAAKYSNLHMWVLHRCVIRERRLVKRDANGMSGKDTEIQGRPNCVYPGQSQLCPRGTL
jgi:hypothetical protein